MLSLFSRAPRPLRMFWPNHNFEGTVHKRRCPPLVLGPSSSTLTIAFGNRLRTNAWKNDLPLRSTIRLRSRR